MPQAPRLAGKPPEPFEAGPPHPPRGTPSRPRGVVDGRPAADRSAHIEAVPLLVDPDLLRRRPEPNEEDVGPGAVYRPDGVLGGLTRRTESARRRIRAHDPQPRVPLPKDPRGPLRDTAPSAAQEHGRASGCSDLAHRGEQIRSGRTTRQRAVEETRRPNEGHPVRQPERRTVTRRPEGRIPVPQHDVLRVGRDHVAASSGVEGGEDGGHSSFEVHAVDLHSQQ